MAKALNSSTKVFITSFGLFLAFGLVMLFWLWDIANDGLKQLEVDQLQRLSQTISLDLYSIEDPSAKALKQWCERWSKRSKHNITLLNLKGQLLAGKDSSGKRIFMDQKDVIQAIEQGFGSSSTLLSGRSRLSCCLKMSFMGGEKAMLMRLQRSPFWEQPLLNASQKKTRWALFWTLLAVGCALWIYSKSITRPLNELEHLAEKLKSRNDDQPLNPKDHLELSAMVKSLNESFFSQQKKWQTITQERKHHEAILAGMKEGLIAFDKKGKISEINRSAKSLLNTPDFKIKGRFLGEILRSNELTDQQQKLTQKGRAFETESVVNQGTGQERIFQVSGYLTGKSDANHHSLMVFTDITRLRRLENMRQGFVANVSHELKTPLTSISGYTEILLDSPDCQDEMAQRFLKRIDHNTKRLTQIIDDLLSLSRIEQKGLSEQEKEQVIVAQFFERLKRDFSIEDLKRIRFFDPQESNMLAHSLLLHQALFNLIDNALKYSGDDTNITVSVHKDNDKKRLCFEVNDNGVGIPQEHLSRLTQRFYRADKDRSREKGGSGLGLSIVKHIAEAHNGEIEIQSTVGKGSSFKLFFPKA